MVQLQMLTLWHLFLSVYNAQHLSNNETIVYQYGTTVVLEAVKNTKWHFQGISNLKQMQKCS